MGSIIVAAAFYVLLSGAGVAQQRSSAILGAGQTSCGTWLAQRQEKSLGEFLSKEWILGFISAISLTSEVMGGTGNIVGDVDQEALFGWIDEFCKLNPTEPIRSATVDLINHLAKSK